MLSLILSIITTRLKSPSGLTGLSGSCSSSMPCRIQFNWNISSPLSTKSVSSFLRVDANLAFFYFWKRSNSWSTLIRFIFICSVFDHTSYTFFSISFVLSWSFFTLLISYSRVFCTSLRYWSISCFLYSRASSSCRVFSSLYLSSFFSISWIFFGILAVWFSRVFVIIAIYFSLVLKSFSSCGWMRELLLLLIEAAALSVAAFFFSTYLID